MKTFFQNLFMFSLVLSVLNTTAQVVVTSTEVFNTSDQMLLANEIFESGEPFAEDLGYNLDDLNPMVLDAPDSISYALGIENYEYSRYLLGTVISRSGIGLHMVWAPMIGQMAAMEPDDFDGSFTGGMANGYKEDDELMKNIMHFGMLANQAPPMNAWPQFADFESGDPHLPQPVQPGFEWDFSSLRWDRNQMSKVLNPAAMGQSLVKQYFWAQDMLGGFHDGDDESVTPDGINSPDFPESPDFDPDNNIYYGGNALDGFIGMVLTAESINKTLFLINSLAYDGNELGMVNPATYNPAEGIKYFPHRVAVTETMVGNMMPPKPDGLEVIDASSELFDQLSYLWGTLKFKNMMDPNNGSDEAHLAYHEVFDGNPFPAPMAETGMPGPFDLMMGTSKVIFMNLMAMHFNMDNGTFVNTSGLAGGMPQPGNEISTVNAGYITMVLALMKEEFAGTPLEQMALDAMNAQSNFLATSLKDPNGGFYNGFTLGVGSDESDKTAIAQAAAARGLYAAFALTGNAAYLAAADEAYDYLIQSFYVHEQLAFKTSENSLEAVYTPENFAIITGGLREATLVGGHTEAAVIYTRFFKEVGNKMQLAEFDPSGETGGDSDGDGVPYLPEQPDHLAPVFATEATMDLNTYEQEIELAVGWSYISSYVDPFQKALENVFLQNGDIVTFMMSNNGIFWPGYNINTIGNWDVYKGYKIKMSQNDNILMQGRMAGNVLNLPAGFSIMPVLSSTNVESSIFEQLGNAFVFAFDIKSGSVYWPGGNLFTLTSLEPGRGYAVVMSQPATLTFPGNLKSVPVQESQFATNTSHWNDFERTDKIHIISVDENALGGLKPGDFIGAFTQDGKTVGISQIKSTPGNLSVIIFGDDINTDKIEGLREDETIVFKAYRNDDQSTINLEPQFSRDFDGAEFKENGTSLITDFKTGLAGIAGVNEDFRVDLYPNPTNGVIYLNIHGKVTPKEVVVSSTTGQIVYTNSINGNSNLSFDLSNLNKGLYFVRIYTDSGVKVQKVLIN